MSSVGLKIGCKGLAALVQLAALVKARWSWCFCCREGLHCFKALLPRVPRAGFPAPAEDRWAHCPAEQWIDWWDILGHIYKRCRKFCPRCWRRTSKRRLDSHVPCDHSPLWRNYDDLKQRQNKITDPPQRRIALRHCLLYGTNTTSRKFHHFVSTASP